MRRSPRRHALSPPLVGYAATRHHSTVRGQINPACREPASWRTSIKINIPATVIKFLHGSRVLGACAPEGIRTPAKSLVVFKIIDRSRQSTPGQARLRHDVMPLGRGKCCMTEKVLGTTHVGRVLSGPKGCRGVPEAMQIDAETEDFLGTLLHGDI